VPAKVVEAAKAADGAEEVRVEYTWPSFYTMRGHMADPKSGYNEWYPVSDVRPANPAAPSSTRLFMPVDFQPELSIITFRWGGANTISTPEQWGETGSSVSDVFINSFIEMAVHPNLGTSYEVWTVYIEDHSDLNKVADTAHLIFGPQHPARRARNCCAMYFLYPTAFEENCIPTMETGEDSGAALLPQKCLYRTIQSMERAGIPTKFPHASGFYEVLTSKRWTYTMSLTPHLRVPPTVSVPRMLTETSCVDAAKHALSSLEFVKEQQAKLRGEEPSKAPITRGVVKLGFSWEALDVKLWEGEAGLVNALEQLTQVIEISQEFTGQPHDLEAIICQEYCQHDLELRQYVVNGKIEGNIYTKFCKIKPNLEFGDFHELFNQKEAADSWMGGDFAALQDGERQCSEITDHWLAWVRAQTCEVPPAIRFDYFVGRNGQGKATVWTLEICELGFSMLGEKHLPAKVFAAMLQSCLRSSPSSLAAGNIPQAKTEAGDEKEPEAESNSTPEASKAPNAGKQSPKASKKKARKAPSVPAVPTIYIKVPGGSGTTEDQQRCTGKYDLEEPDGPKGCPLWAHSNGERWLYLGDDDYWYVGDDEEQADNFMCSRGYIRHLSSPGVPPHELGGPWERCSANQPDTWKPDVRIAVSTEEIVLPAKPSKGKGKHNKRR